MQVAVLDDWEDAAARYLSRQELPAGVSVTVFHDHARDADHTVRRLRPFDAVIVMRERTPLPAEVLTRLPNLKLVVTSGGANAVIDMASATSRGIVVCAAPAARMAQSVTELTFGLILSLARRIPQQDRGVRAGEWGGHVSVNLAGRTLGLLGLGSIGARVARVAHAFGMNVVAWSEHLTEERAEEVGVRRVSLADCFAESDFVSIHLRLSERTAGLVDGSLLDLMKPTAFLVNTSRAGIVDTDALRNALALRRIAGAATDVYDVEPAPPDEPLLGLDSRTVLTPHIGYVSEATYEDFYAGYADALRAWVAGEPVNVLNEVTAAPPST